MLYEYVKDIVKEYIIDIDGKTKSWMNYDKSKKDDFNGL